MLPADQQRAVNCKPPNMALEFGREQPAVFNSISAPYARILEQEPCSNLGHGAEHCFAIRARRLGTEKTADAHSSARTTTRPFSASSRTNSRMTSGANS